MPRKDGRGGRKPIIILESEIRDAMKHTKSNKAAALWLKVSYNTYRKWAIQYIDAGTKKTLFDIQLNPTGIGIGRPTARGRRSKGGKGSSMKALQDILDNKVPKYPLHKLKHRLWRANLKAKECDCCGYGESRITDGEYPLVVSHKNGDKEDFTLENLEILCYNCYFVTVGNPWGRRKWYYNKPHHTKAPDAMRQKDMIENVEVDIDGNPVNLDSLGTYPSANIIEEEIQMDNNHINDFNISKGEIEDFIKDTDNN